MMGKEKQIRNRWLHIRLNETEWEKITSLQQQTTSAQLSAYARNVLLKKPVVVRYRNASADEILSEMIRLKKELNAIGVNFNQVVHKLHTLDHLKEIRTWLDQCEPVRRELLRKVEEICLIMQEIYRQWLPK